MECFEICYTENEANEIIKSLKLKGCTEIHQELLEEPINEEQTEFRECIYISFVPPFLR